MSQHSVNNLPETLHTLGRPLDLSPDAFGFFRETDVDEDVEVQQNRISDEGIFIFATSGVVNRSRRSAIR